MCRSGVICCCWTRADKRGTTPPAVVIVKGVETTLVLFERVAGLIIISLALLFFFFQFQFNPCILECGANVESANYVYRVTSHSNTLLLKHMDRDTVFE